MNMKKQSLLTAVLLAAIANTSAQAGQAPNYYKCSGSNTQLTLTLGMDAEVGIYPVNTELSLNTGAGKHSFSKAQIDTLSTVMGTIYQVELPAPDDSSVIKHASVIIPDVLVDTALVGSTPASPLKFKTKLIVTREAVKPDPAFAGVVNPSTYTDLTCRADVLYW